MKTYTLQDLGPRLPIGIPHNGGLQKSFTLRPFKTKIDRHLAKWIKDNADRDPLVLEAMKVGKLISLLVSSVGDMAFAVDEKGNSPAEQEAKIYNWFMADVMYLYMYARCQAVGSKMTLPIACPNCKYSTTDAVFDLNHTEVLVVEDVKQLTKWIKLQDPFLLRDGKTRVNSVKLGPVKWSTYCKPGVLDAEIDTFDPDSLRDSICAINNDDQRAYTMTDAEIDELSKRDFTRINQTTAEVSAGPDIRTVIPCPSCNFPITSPLQWTYDFFFDGSFHVETPS